MGSSSTPSGEQAYNILTVSKVANIVGVVKGSKINVENFIATKGVEKKVEHDKQVSINGVINSAAINIADGIVINTEGESKVIAGNHEKEKVIGKSTYTIDLKTEAAGIIGVVKGGTNTITFSTEEKPRISVKQGEYHENRAECQKTISPELGKNHYFCLDIKHAGIVGVLTDTDKGKEIKVVDFNGVPNEGKITVETSNTTQEIGPNGEQAPTFYNISPNTEVAGIIGVINDGTNRIENCTATSGARGETQGKDKFPAIGIVGVINGGTNHVK